MERSEAPAHLPWLRSPSLDSLLAYSLIAAVLIWRSWATYQWTFQGDDWRWIADAMRTPFLRYVFTPYNGHLLPGQFAIVWVVTRLAPLNYTLAMAPMLLATLVGGVLMWRLLRTLFGDHPANLIPLGVFMLCPASLRAALWLAGGLGLIPMQTLIVATLFAVLLYVRAPSARRLAAVGLTYSGALLLWEKALLIVPLAILFVLLFLGEGSGRERLRSVSVGRWRLWAVFAGITVPYVAWYAAVVRSGYAVRAPLSEAGQYIGTAVGSTVIPTYLGGPWRAPISGNAAIYQLPRLLQLVTWLAFGAIVGSSLLLRRQAWRAWVLPAVYLAMCLALVAFGRLSLLGPVLGLDTRYVADSVPVFALALGLAFMTPLERRVDPAWDRRRLVVSSRSDAAADPSVRTRIAFLSRMRIRRLSPRQLAIGVVALYAFSAMITSSRIAGLADTYSSKPWLGVVRAELASHPTASVVDGNLPSTAIQAVLFPDVAKLSVALAPIAPHIRWDAPSDNPLVFDASGHLRPAEVVPLTTGKPSHTPGCGYLVYRNPTLVPLEHGLSAGVWGVRFAYFTDTVAQGWVSTDGDRQDVQFLRGLHGLTLIHSGTAAAITFWARGSPVCVGWVQVGAVQPATDGSAPAA